MLLLGAGAVGAFLLYSRLRGGLTNVAKDLGKSAYGEEERWEIRYKSQPNASREFIGFKSGLMFNNYDPKAVGNLFGLPAGVIKCNMLKYATAVTGKQHGGLGWLHCPASYRFIFKGKTVDKIQGDPRALYSLDALMRVSGLTSLSIASLYRPGDAHDFGHKSGCAIDLTNEHEFVKILAAANKVRMPICAIMRQPQGPWPINVWAMWDKNLPGPIAKRVASESKSPHRNHHHVILPRPNLVQGYFNKSGQAGKFSPGPPPINPN